MKSFNLLLKILVQPNIPVGTLLGNMKEIYEPAGMTFKLVSTEVLNLPSLKTVQVNNCDTGSLTNDQTKLFGHRNGAGSKDIVVYFVGLTLPVFNGCAIHPPDRPGALVVANASQWTLAHEVGHVLLLPHVSGSTRLMTEFTKNLPDPPLPLTPQEAEIMAHSPLTTAV